MEFKNSDSPKGHFFLRLIFYIQNLSELILVVLILFGVFF